MQPLRLQLSAVVLLVALCTFFGPTGPVSAQAQQTHLPIVGRLFVAVGADVRAGPVIDWSDDWNTSAAVGPRARLGFHHIITESLSMNAEAAIGATYLSDHPMAPTGQADAEIAFDWSVAVLARRMPIGPRRGWTFAGGPHYRNLSLAQGSLIQFGVEGRIGYSVWTDDERFFIVELGIHMPLIEGLNIAQHAMAPEAPLEENWTLPSASLGIQWAF